MPKLKDVDDLAEDASRMNQKAAADSTIASTPSRRDERDEGHTRSKKKAAQGERLNAYLMWHELQ